VRGVYDTYQRFLSRCRLQHLDSQSDTMVVCAGSERPQVQAERHYHPVKAQLVTAGAMGALAAAAAGVLAPLVGFNPWSLIGVETAFWGFLVTMGAGLGAQLAPHLFRQAHETEHQRAHDADMESIMRSGLGPFNPGDREHQVLTSYSTRSWFDVLLRCECANFLSARRW